MVGRATDRSVRILEAAAGLLSAGLLMLGLALTAAIFLAPALVGGSGFEAATGPRPDRALVQLAVGLTGEAARLFRHRLPTPARVAIAALILLAGGAALWWGWWR